MTLPSGHLVADRFRIDQPIGEGGSGSVYLAHDLMFEAPIALKVSAPHARADRFAREAHLSHWLGRELPHVVRTIAWGQLERDDDLPALYLAMDYVPDAAPLDLRQAPLLTRLRALTDAATLIAEVHTRGVLHRDLKPSNFLRTDLGDVYLTDFGLAKRLDARDPQPTDVTTNDSAGGTPSYMPIEQFEDLGSVDARADVYALGVMLFEILQGARPYTPQDTTLGYLKAQWDVVEGRASLPEVELNPGIPSDLADLCAAAIQPRRDRRLGSAAQLAARLRVACDLLATSAHPGAELDGDTTRIAREDTDPSL